MEKFKYAHVCVTCKKRKQCEWNNGYFLTCNEYKEDKEYQPKRGENNA